MKKISILVLLFSVVIFSCKQEKVEIKTGKIRGTVNMITDEFNEILSFENTPIEVKLVGGEDSLVTTTDSKGNYEFENVKQGVYNLYIGSNPFGTYKYNFSFVGGDKPYIVPSVVLSHKSSVIFSSERFKIVNGKLRIIITFAGIDPTGYYGFVMFRYKNNKILEKKYLGNYNHSMFLAVDIDFDKIVIRGKSGGKHDLMLDNELLTDADPTLSNDFVEYTVTD